MTTPTVTITVRLTPEELQNVDEIRGSIPRERWVRGAILQRIQATSEAERSPA